MTRVTQLIHDAGKYLLISVYPLPTHPTHNFSYKNGGNLDTLPGWPKKLDHNRPARCAGQKPISCDTAPTVSSLFRYDNPVMPMTTKLASQQLSDLEDKTTAAYMSYQLWISIIDLRTAQVYWDAILFGQPGSVSNFPPFLWVKLWVGWVGRGYIEISRYFPALWINRVTLVTKIKLWYSLGY